VYYSNNFERLSGGVVDDEARAHGPKEHRLVCEILARVSNSRVLGNPPAVVNKFQANPARSFNTVLSDVGPDFQNAAGGLGGEGRALELTRRGQGGRRIAIVNN
jgi:hypothetical protein